jgi:hypothetical protein
MKKPYFLRFLSITGFVAIIMFATNVKAQCPLPSDNFQNFGYYDLTPTTQGTAGTKTGYATWGGEYHKVDVTSGETYEISACNSGPYAPGTFSYIPGDQPTPWPAGTPFAGQSGFDVGWDPQMTLINAGTGTVVGFNDDYCGVYPSIEYTATFTGELRVYLDSATVCDQFEVDSLIIQVTWLDNACTDPTSGGTIASDESGCSGYDPANITSSVSPSGHTGDLEYKWQSSTTSTSTGFSDISGAISETYDPSTITTTTWYKRLARVDCSADWTGAAESNVITKTVYDAFTAGAIATSGETICYNGDPGQIGNSTTASGGDGSISYKWQSSTTSESTGFSDIGGATSSTYDPPSGLMADTWYRRLANDGSCNTTFTASTGTWKVTVRSQFTAGEIETTGESICYNGDPSEIGSSADASGGDGMITYKWQSSTTSSSTGFSDIESAPNSTYNPPSGLMADTWYRRMAKDGTCNTSYTESTGTWKVTVNNEFTPGAIETTGEEFCSGGGNPAEIGSSTAASGGDGSISYQWQSSTASSSTGFSDIGGATSASYDPPSIVTVDTWYRRMAKDGTCNTTYTASTGIWQVSILPVFTTGSIETTGETICYNGDPSEIGSASDASGGDGSISYKWQSSTTSSSTGFSDIGGATSSSYNPPSGHMTDTWYRRLAKDGTCNTTFTESAGTWMVTVNDEFSAGTIETTGETICYSSDPSEIGSTTAASGGDGSLTYQWQYSTDNFQTMSSTISNSNTTTYDPPSGLTETTWYRRQAKDGTCNTTFTSSTGTWKVTVRDEFTAGAIQTTGETICYNGDPSEIGSATEAGGGDGTISYQWQSSTTSSSTGFSDISGATLSSYDPPSGLMTDTWYRRMANDGTCNTSYTAATGTWKVTVLSQFTTGEIETAGEIICYNGDPSEIGSTTDASGGDGSISYQWQSSTTSTSTGFSDISGATSSSYDPPSGLMVDTWYRRMAKDGTCNTTYTESTGIWKVTVYTEFIVGSISDDQSVCVTDPIAELIGEAPTGGNTPYTYQWQISDDGLNFSNIMGATSLNYQPSGLTDTTYFKLLQSSAMSCGTLETNVVEIAVHSLCCEVTATTCQGPDPENLTGYVSDVGDNSKIYDNFSGIIGGITDITWWGTTGDLSSNCNENPKNFEITFYRDNNGAVGEVVHTFNVEITGTPTGSTYGTGYAPILMYSYTLSYPVSGISSGWVSIQGNPAGSCSFTWMTSALGDGMAIVDGVGKGPVMDDFAYSLTADPSIPLENWPIWLGITGLGLILFIRLRKKLARS